MSTTQIHQHAIDKQNTIWNVPDEPWQRSQLKLTFNNHAKNWANHVIQTVSFSMVRFTYFAHAGNVLPQSGQVMLEVFTIRVTGQ